METIRLICTYKCNRSCVGCCNTQDNYIEDNVPAISEDELINTLSRYDELIITGGEPMLFHEKLVNFVLKLNESTSTSIYIYTSVMDITLFDYISDLVKGITLSLHEMYDVKLFNIFHRYLIDLDHYSHFRNNTNRLNVFPGMKELIDPSAFEYWDVKEIKMLDDCPLPENEILYKLDKLW